MLALAVAAALQGWSLPAARDCTAAETAALLAPPDADDAPYRLLCRARLAPGQTVTRRILLEGAAASGAGIDCAGGAIGRPGRPSTTAAPTIAVRSRPVSGPAPAWSRPTDIVIRRCTVHGAIRIAGMGADGYEALRASSQRPDHTAAAQAAAPSHVTLSEVTLVATGSIPLYIGSGATWVSVDRSRFTGASTAVAVYLDAESADNRITDSDFDIVTGREQIAVDGSSRNRITGNRFALGGRGGVFLYRNCGERGVVRHQTPSFNVISDNAFAGAARLRPRLVVVGAREGRRSYCGDDAGLPFGSSVDDGDHAEGNLVARNRAR